MADPQEPLQHPKIKHSIAVGDEPDAIAVGELAINVADTPTTMFVGGPTGARRVVPQNGAGAGLPSTGKAGAFYVDLQTRTPYYHDGVSWNPFGGGGGDPWNFINPPKTTSWTANVGDYYFYEMDHGPLTKIITATMTLPANPAINDRVGVRVLNPSFGDQLQISGNGNLINSSSGSWPWEELYLAGYAPCIIGVSLVFMDTGWQSYSNVWWNVSDERIAATDVSYDNPEHPLMDNVAVALTAALALGRETLATFNSRGAVKPGEYLNIGEVSSDKTGWVNSGTGFISKVTIGRSDFDSAFVEILVNGVPVQEFETSAVSAAFDGLIIPLTDLDQVSARVKAGSNQMRNVVVAATVKQLSI